MPVRFSVIVSESKVNGVTSSLESITSLLIIPLDSLIVSVSISSKDLLSWSDSKIKLLFFTKNPISIKIICSFMIRPKNKFNSNDI